MAFVHLHLHTAYSLLDGAIRIKDLAPRLKELGMDSCAITDHGVLYGSYEFYRSMKQEGIKPILGCEVYVAKQDMRVKEGSLAREPHHLILLAETQEGWHNIIKLSSLGFTEGFYYRPRIDFATLQKHAKGIICLSACLGGEIPQSIMSGDLEGARRIAKQYDECFGRDNFYLEVQSNGIEEQRLVNEELIAISKETGIPLVATNDCHYLKKEDALAQDVMLCLQTGKKLHDENRMKMHTDAFYVKSPEEMQEAFLNIPEAIENTVKIAERCHAEIETGHLFLPDFKTPDGVDSVTFLRQLSQEGLDQRYAQRPEYFTPEVKAQYQERLEKELDVIISMGYTDYYLVVWDYIKHARELDIMVGPGRGSGAASLVAYVLWITNVDPIQYHLIFERFLNPERVSMPDFDCDFEDTRRDELIEYVTEKYGEDHVCQVITFGTLGARSVIRDVARVLDYPYAEGDRLAKMVPTQLNITIEEALDLNPDLKKEYDLRPESKEILDLSLKLEGMPRHASTHAAGVVISGVPINEVAPLARNDEAIVVQYNKEEIEDIGLLKFDFLGLRYLTVLHDAARLIKENTGVEIDFDQIPFDDPKVFDMLGEGKTAGVFQLEASGMTNFIKEMKPRSLEDIIAGISLYRPGPMEQIPRYIANANKKIEYEHPLLEDILNGTRGCMVYQEQVMQISRTLAGFSMGQSDNIRRAMSKKKPELLAQYRQLFVHGGTDENDKQVDGAIKRGVPETVANKIFDEMMAFAGYAFNKAHAAGYAVIAYHTAFLKLYYPVEYMAATLNSFLGELSKAAFYVRVAQEMNIEILPPDINKSEVLFSTEGGSIRFALASVKNVGRAAMEKLVKDRKQNGEYHDFEEFLSRAVNLDLNRKAVESLIKSSALDSLGLKRSQMMGHFDGRMKQIQESKNRRWENQISFLDLDERFSEELETPEYADMAELTENIRLAQEKEVLGLYVTGHPLNRFRSILEKYCSLNSIELNPEVMEDENISDLEDRQKHVMAGQIISIRRLFTRNNEQMAFVGVEDLSGVFEVIVFPRIFEQYRDYLSEENVLLIAGQLSIREDEEPKLIAEHITLLEEEDFKLPADFPGWARTLTATTSPRIPGVGERPSEVVPRPVSEYIPQQPEFEEKRATRTPNGLQLLIYLGNNDENILRAMVRYFSGDLAVSFINQTGHISSLGMGIELEYLPYFIKRYGEQAVTII